MIQIATSSANDGRLRFATGVAERLPYPDSTFDLVLTTTSFDHWSDQQAGLLACARVLAPGGQLVLVDVLSGWLAPTMLAGRRGRADSERSATKLLHRAGQGKIPLRHLARPLRHHHPRVHGHHLKTPENEPAMRHACSTSAVGRMAGDRHTPGGKISAARPLRGNRQLDRGPSTSWRTSPRARVRRLAGPPSDRRRSPEAPAGRPDPEG